MKKDASVTVYACLSLVICGTLLLCLAEAARWEGLHADAGEWTNLAAESLCAGYQPYLLQEYRMFFLDGDFGGEDFDEDAMEAWMAALLYDNAQLSGTGDGMNLYRMCVEEMNITEYMLATDQDGKVFQHYAAEQMKSTMGEQAARALLNRVEDIQQKKRDGGDPEGSIANGENTLVRLEEERRQQEEAANAAAAAQPSQTEEDGGMAAQRRSYGAAPTAAAAPTAPAASGTNPYQEIKSARQQGILSLVLPQGASVSGKAHSLENSLLRRRLKQGSCRENVSGGWYERILMQEWIKNSCGSYRSPQESGALSYGMEYLICGKDSDQENLKKTAQKLLLLRETVNYLYLQTDEAKKAEAMTAAALLAGASANPLAVEAVKQGILAAWAYAESICDTRALLAGGRIPLMKNNASWQMQLANLGQAAASNYQGESSGFTYENYLDAFLYAASAKTAAFRCMDLMEWGMQKHESYAHAKMDHMMLSVTIQAEYHAASVFSGILDRDPLGGYRFVRQSTYQYQ